MKTKNTRRALVVTTINPPNTALCALAKGAIRQNVPFYVAGDKKSPVDFHLEGATFLSIADQEARFPELCKVLPQSHYTRKNVAYLSAIHDGAEEIQETDDDNIPSDEFWAPLYDTQRSLQTKAPWFNVYSLFTDETIWPRGFPLEFVNDNPVFELTNEKDGLGLIQQGLADGNPDVDAVFRFTRKLPIRFERRPPVLLSPGVWSPFNSQNTIFQRAVFPLLYLPSYCSFRATDIWRSLIAQRCLWELDEGVVFHSATVFQERNEHSLLRDFEDEISGYLLNDKIRVLLESLKLMGRDMLRNLQVCYEAMVKQSLLPAEELLILREWEKALIAQR